MPDNKWRAYGFGPQETLKWDSTNAARQVQRELDATVREMDAAIAAGRGDVAALNSLRSLVGELKACANAATAIASRLAAGKHVTQAEKEKAMSVGDDLAAISAKIRGLKPAPAAARGDYNVSEYVAPAPAKWSRSPLITIRSPFTYNIRRDI